MICEMDDCETPTMDVQDYYAFAPFRIGPEFLCRRCRDAKAERVAEQMDEAFYGGSGPQTVMEQYESAARVKRGLR